MKTSTDNAVIFQVAFQSHKGQVRDGNEDNLILNTDLRNQTVEGWTWANNETDLTLSPAGAMLVVADGMGGLNAGEEASRIAVESIRNYFNKFEFDGQPLTTERIRGAMFDAVHFANLEIEIFSKKNPESKGLGTTAVLVWLHGNTANVAWVGDSRVYLQRRGQPIHQLSRDHSLVQELVDAGKITEEQAFFHPDKNIITQSLGDSGHVPRPSFHQETVYTGDRIVLCSDGLNTMVNDARISELMRDMPGVKTCAERLVSEANAEGGYDNITVIVCDVMQASEGAVPPPPRPVRTAAAEPQLTTAPMVAPTKKTSRTKVFGAGIALGLALFALLYFFVLRSGAKPPVELEGADSTKVDTNNLNKDTLFQNGGAGGLNDGSEGKQHDPGKTANQQSSQQRAQSPSSASSAIQPVPSDAKTQTEQKLNPAPKPEKTLTPAIKEMADGTKPGGATTAEEEDEVPELTNEMLQELKKYIPRVQKEKMEKYHIIVESFAANKYDQAFQLSKLVKEQVLKKNLNVLPFILEMPGGCGTVNCYFVVLSSHETKPDAEVMANRGKVKRLFSKLGKTSLIVEY